MSYGYSQKYNNLKTVWGSIDYSKMPKNEHDYACSDDIDPNPYPF